MKGLSGEGSGSVTNWPAKTSHLPPEALTGQVTNAFRQVWTCLTGRLKKVRNWLFPREPPYARLLAYSTDSLVDIQ